MSHLLSVLDWITVGALLALCAIQLATFVLLRAVCVRALKAAHLCLRPEGYSESERYVVREYVRDALKMVGARPLELPPASREETLN